MSAGQELSALVPWAHWFHWRVVPTPGSLLGSLIQQKPVWGREGSSDISSNLKSHFKAAVKVVPPILT